MNHIDLFSGIGGFAIAAKEVWKDEYNTVAFCDNNTFAQAVLRRHFPEAAIYGDIRELTRDKLVADTKGRRYKSQEEKICSGRDATITCDLLTGGFPCQPFSQAGKRKGVADNRYLWPEMLRVIQEFKPTWIIAENVRGLLTMQQGMVFENICLDLEKSGYEVQPFIIPACAVNAPHRRDRVWIVGHAISDGYKKGFEETRREDGQSKQGWVLQFEGTDSNASDTSDKGLQRDKQSGTLGKRSWASRSVAERDWNESWLEAATSLCVMDDGLPRGLVRLPNGTAISKSKWRQEALKAAGNAIVPQVAIEIMTALQNEHFVK